MYRGALRDWIEVQLEEVADGQVKTIGGGYIDDEGRIMKFAKHYTSGDMTQERVEEYLEALEDVKPLPLETVSVLPIICEEAEAYFNGSRSIQEVSVIIQNRVQLYLDENGP